MLGARGVTVDVWAQIDDNCPVSCIMSEDGAELTFGDWSRPLALAVSRETLESLVSTVSAALRTPSDARVDHDDA